MQLQVLKELQKALTETFDVLVCKHRMAAKQSDKDRKDGNRQMLKVYGADICRDCMAMKKIFADKEVEYEYMDFILNTANMREFFAIRDHAAIYEDVRNREGGGIGIPLFVKGDRMSFDINEALRWEGKEPVEASEYEQIAERMGEFIKLQRV
ncbi:MAG: hypothetical protein HFG66_04980 [Hungatella sp.]|jgi:glutaredoxin-related protein|nr:hypothetical protein [Hungatella sp.]